MILVSQIMSALLQLTIFSGIPLLWYLITHRQARGFFAWLGIKTSPQPPLKEMACILIGFLTATILPYMWLYHTGNLNYQGLTIEAYYQYGWGMQTILVILVWAVLQTSLCEEILFRGFLCKRFSHLFGEKIGNFIQALLFGAVHVLALPEKNLPAIVMIVALTGGIGYALGWLSKKASGSILYGWAIHATVNILSPIVVFIFLL